MARTPLWKSIASSLTDDISEGRYEPGDKLPSEAELSRKFGVNRHTVRHALSSMADSGLTHSRRGAGVFVTARPTEYPIGKRVRFHQNLTAAGRLAKREILHMETRQADTREAEALALAPGSRVHIYEALSFSDGAPLSLSRSAFPADRFPEIFDRLKDTRSVTAALKANGVQDYTRASTRLTAKPATPTQALLLKIPEGAPILRSVGINVDPDGIPVEYGRTYFAGDRVTLTMGQE